MAEIPSSSIHVSIEHHPRPPAHDREQRCGYTDLGISDSPLTKHLISTSIYQAISVSLISGIKRVVKKNGTNYEHLVIRFA
jgi:hypothetical protein